jgi:hypothetical protein
VLEDWVGRELVVDVVHSRSIALEASRAWRIAARANDFLGESRASSVARERDT